MRPCEQGDGGVKTTTKLYAVAGEINRFNTSHGYRLSFDERSRLFDASLILQNLAADLDAEMADYHRRKDASTA
jgi:hypothetical protein